MRCGACSRSARPDAVVLFEAMIERAVETIERLRRR
jgi:hypothetical protein